MSRKPRYALLLVLFLFVATFGRPARAEGHVISAGMQPEVEAFVRQLAPLPCGLKVADVSIQQNQIVMGFSSGDGRRAAFSLVHPSGTQNALYTGTVLALHETTGLSSCPALRTHLVAAVPELEKRFVWKRLDPPPRKPENEAQVRPQLADVPPPALMSSTDDERRLLPDVPRTKITVVFWLIWWVALLAGLVSFWRTQNTTDRLCMAASFLLATLARLVLVTPRMTTIHSDSFFPALAPDARFGPGGQVLEAIFYTLGSAGSSTLFTGYVVFGALASVLVFATGRALKFSTLVSFGAALIIALLPLHVILSASDAEHVLIATLVASLMWAISRNATAPAAHWSNALVFSAPVLMLAIRFDSLSILPGFVVLQFTTTPLRPLQRRRWLLLFAGWVLGAALYFGPYAASMEGQIGAIKLGAFLNAALFLPMPQEGYTAAPLWTPLAVIVLFYIGLFAGLRTRSRLILALVLIHLIWLAPSIFNYYPNNPMRSRYFLHVTFVHAIVAAWGLAWLHGLASRRIPYPRIIGILLVMLLALAVIVGERERYKIRQAFEAEYVFLRQHLPLIPRNCVLMRVPDEHPYCEDLLVVDESLIRLDRPDIHWIAPDSYHPDLECVVYFKRAACSYSAQACGGIGRASGHFQASFSRWRDACEAVERTFTLEPLAELQTRVVTQYANPPDAEIEIGLYRVANPVRDAAYDRAIESEKTLAAQADLLSDSSAARPRNLIPTWLLLGLGALCVLALSILAQRRGLTRPANMLVTLSAIAFALAVLELLISSFSRDAGQEGLRVDQAIRTLYPQLADSCYATNPRGYFLPYRFTALPELTAYCTFSAFEARKACDTERDAAGDERRILAIGDSFTEAVGVHYADTWPQKLGEFLSGADDGKSVRPINCGKASTNIDELRERLNVALVRHRPQVVIYALVLNDIFTAHEAELLTARINQPIMQAEGRRLGLASDPLVKKLAETSRVVRLFMERYERGLITDATTELYHEVYRSPETPEFKHLIQQISRMQSAASDVDAEFLVVLWPLFYKLHDYPFSDAHSLIRSECARHGVAALDLLDVFAGQDETAYHVYPGDDHPNEVAQRLAAERIADELARRGWVATGKEGTKPASVP